jgi:hypothetical protein
MGMSQRLLGDCGKEIPSPFFHFLLCTKGLSSLLKQEEESGNLIGVKVCRSASHFLFATTLLLL